MANYDKNDNIVHLDELNDINFNIGEPANTNLPLDQKIDLSDDVNHHSKKDLESVNQIKSEDYISKEEKNRYDNGTMDEPIYITLVFIRKLLLETRFIPYSL